LRFNRNILRKETHALKETYKENKETYVLEENVEAPVLEEIKETRLLRENKKTSVLEEDILTLKFRGSPRELFLDLLNYSINHALK
jgi:hypothetical protein